MLSMENGWKMSFSLDTALSSWFIRVFAAQAPESVKQAEAMKAKAGCLKVYY